MNSFQKKDPEVNIFLLWWNFQLKKKLLVDSKFVTKCVTDNFKNEKVRGQILILKTLRKKLNKLLALVKMDLTKDFIILILRKTNSKLVMDYLIDWSFLTNIIKDFLGINELGNVNYKLSEVNSSKPDAAHW